MRNRAATLLSIAGTITASIHEAAVGALLVLPPFGEVRTEVGAHRIGRQSPHLGVGGSDLIGQRVKPLTRCLSSHEFAHTTTLSIWCVD
jgi:hypothetical protein